MAPRRLLVVSDEMEVGGSQRQILQLLSGLNRREWQPELLYFRGHSWMVEELARLGIPLHRLPKRGRIDSAFAWRLAALLRRGRYDVVHAFSLTAEIWTLAARLALPRRPRLVASVRGLYQDQTPLFWRLKRTVLHRADAIIANSAAAARLAAGRTGLPAGRIRVIPNGVVVPPLPATGPGPGFRAGLGVPPGRTMALFVGRLVPDKNIGCLLRALASLPAQERPWLAVAGDGPLREELELLAVRLGIAGDVGFLGERSDPGALMHAADFLVLPSRQEGLSNVLLEAMALGCPALASAVGGTPEVVVDGETGLLFADDDVDALTLCLRRLGGDPALRGALAERARARVLAGYSVERMVRSTTAVYVQCLSPGIARESAEAPGVGR